MLSAQNEPETGMQAPLQTHCCPPAAQTHNCTKKRRSSSSIKARSNRLVSVSDRNCVIILIIYIDVQEMYDVLPSVYGLIDGRIIYWLVYLLIGEDALVKQMWHLYFPRGTLSFWCIFPFFYVHFEMCFSARNKTQWRINKICSMKLSGAENWRIHSEPSEGACRVIRYWFS